MIKLTFSASALLLMALGTFQPCHAQGPTSVDVVNGQCSDTSHTAEGPIGADLTQRHSRFFCNSAVIASFDKHFHHVMIQFSEKESQHNPILGFAGTMDTGGIILNVDHLYYADGRKLLANDGNCKFFFTGKKMKGIFCGAKVDDQGDRTVAIVGFDVNE